MNYPVPRRDRFSLGLRLAGLGGLLAAALALTPLHAATQSNFMVSPPPLPWFEFEKGQWDLRVGGNYTSVTGKDSGSGKDISIKGGGVNFVGRYAFSDLLAIDMGYYFFYIGGGIPNVLDMAMYMNSWNPNLEMQLLKNNSVSWIIFFGGMFSYTPVDVTDRSTAAAAKYGASIYLNGPQFGTQLSVKAGSFALSPFVLLQSLSGTFSVTSPAYSASVPAFTMTSFGVDVTYIPWNITLSSVINQATAATQNNGFNTFYIALSYDFRWGVAPRLPDQNEIPPEPAKPVQNKPTRKKR